MKKIKFLLLGVLITSFVSAQEKKSWKEMDEFHAVMSSTFHPAEEGNLAPIKARSGEMMEKAIAWQNANPPEGFNKKNIKKPLKELVKGTKKLNSMTKANANDKQIAGTLSGLHDIFHEIMEKCEDGENHSH